MMNSIHVMTFGAVTDILGKSRFTLSGPQSTEELRVALEKEYPALKNIQYAIAVDRKVVSQTTPLNGQETVALLPPFSGG